MCKQSLNNNSNMNFQSTMSLFSQRQIKQRKTILIPDGHMAFKGQNSGTSLKRVALHTIVE